MKNRVTLREYIRELLKDGKRREHEDFQRLIRLFGDEHITKLAKEVLKEEKAKDVAEEKT